MDDTNKSDGSSTPPESASPASHEVPTGADAAEATEAGVGDEAVLTKTMVDEEEKLQQQALVEERRMNDEKHKEYEAMTEKLKQDRYENLCLLLSKSTLYTNYLIGRMERQKDEEKRRQERSQKKTDKEKGQEETVEEESVNTACDASSRKSTESETDTSQSVKSGDVTSPAANRRSARVQAASPQPTAATKRPGRKRKAEDADNSPKITGFFTSPRASSKRRRVDEKTEASERESAENKTKNEVAGQKSTSDPDDWERKDGVRLFNGKPVPAEQPHLLTGGLLRQYQIEGFTWLSSLFENGINGILADEMGLGKTIQCISLVAKLVWKGVPGPFLVCAPLSTVPNWVAEFKRFAPRVPVILYHGSIEERGKLRNKIHKNYAVRKGIQTNPVMVTSYEIAMNDRKLLANIEWKLLIIDEGHRIKNFRCRLIRELKMYRSTHRLLLTGTPLQNNLSELWSLLNFLLPEIFDDLGSFEMWFDLDVLQSSGVDDEIVQEEKKHNILAMLHQVLTPFMLRRLKADVDLDVPPKREMLVYAPLMERQEAMYRAVLDESIREFVIGKKEEEVFEQTEWGRPVRKSRSKIDYTLLLDMNGNSEGTCPSSSSSEEEEDDQEVPTTRKARTSRKKRKSKKLSRTPGKQNVNADDDDDDNDVEAWAESMVKARLGMQESSNNTRQSTEPTDKQVNIQLRNKLSILRKSCNHPYLIEYPLTGSDNFKIDEGLVNCSGKMLLLDRVLTSLKRDNHKVLIFSQMTSMLDILQDYCYLRDYKCCRLQGNLKIEERHEQITRFNTDPEQFVFLLSTRAGGLGINLTSADTVIIFDSDWNPQCDLQAQDRCHRIGQTQPVLILRLVTANTVDQKIVEKAAAKRKLEKMVIHRGKFKVGMDHQQFDINELELLNMDELRSMLKEGDYDRVVDHRKRQVISDDDLARLLDRSDLREMWLQRQQQAAPKRVQKKRGERVKISDVSGVFKIISEDLESSVDSANINAVERRPIKTEIKTDVAEKTVTDKENLDTNKVR